MKNKTVYYRQGSFVTSMMALGFFIPFLSIIPLIIILSGEVYKDENVWTRPMRKRASLAAIVLIFYWVLGFISAYFKSDIWFNFYEIFVKTIFIGAILLVIFWQVKKFFKG